MASQNLVLREISCTELVLSPPTSNVCKNDFEALVSYNWQNKTEPTILVPGMHPLPSRAWLHPYRETSNLFFLVIVIKS